MAVIELNKDPSRRELNVFGGLFALFFGIVGALIHWKFEAPTVAMTVWCVAAAVVVVFFAVPPVRLPIYLGWIYAAYPIGWTLSHVLLAIIFYGMFTPIGLVMRLLGHDPMQRRLDRDAKTYWSEHNPGGEPGRYFRQF